MKSLSLKNHVFFTLFLFCCLLCLSGPLVRAEESSSSEAEETDLYNILLIGTDLREGESWNGNSDVMILISVNDSTQKIIMTSFMRDLYADIPGYGGHKLNYAYAVGGASTLIDTLEDNYDLEIDNYAAVDFPEMAEIIDLIGGVDIEVSDSEASLMNSYLEAMGQYDQYLYGGGTYHLTGYQAVAYMRVRYVGNDDYERTERQRSVLTELFAGLSDMSVAELTQLALKVLALTDSDLSALDLISLVNTFSDAVNYSLEENRIPYDGLYTSENGNLVPDFPATIDRLHEDLYE